MGSVFISRTNFFGSATVSKSFSILRASCMVWIKLGRYDAQLNSPNNWQCTHTNYQTTEVCLAEVCGRKGPEQRFS